MTCYRYATPRPGEDVLTRVPRRTGAPFRAIAPSGAPYRHAHPAEPVRMAHPIRPAPLLPDFGQQFAAKGGPIPAEIERQIIGELPAHRSRIAPDLLAIAVILAVVLAASLAGVRL